MKIFSFETTEKLMDSRLDLICLIEYGDPFPVLFENKNGLVGWAREERLNIDSIGCISESNCVMISGNYHFKFRSEYMYIESVWVRANWAGYRTALEKRSAMHGYGDGFSSVLHADHVVARSRLADVPNAWTLLFEVPSQANTIFGSRIERHLKKIAQGFRRYDLSGLEILKIFCNEMPKRSDNDVDGAIQRVKDHFLVVHPYVEKMLGEMEAVARGL